ncbi:MAG TPA: HlyD family efflux transporter periplasmic adaptor subunit [Arcobacter sp.]|jgi:epimerase transport system membrane fusion protein|nr:HlyD family efflux transporter periplasmic adaptor subunit [Arcobacter sp.]
MENTIIEQNDDKGLSKKILLLWLFIMMVIGFILIYVFVLKNITDVVVKGHVISKNYNKIIKSPNGGFVTKLNVEQGDFVKKGEPLVFIDNKPILQRLQRTMYKYDQLLFKQMRYQTEADNNDNISFIKIKNQLMINQHFDLFKQQSEKLFQTQKDTLKIKILSLIEKNNSLTADNIGLQHFINLKSNELALDQQELSKYKLLYKKKMVNQIVIFNLKRKMKKTLSNIDIQKANLDSNLKKIQVNNYSIKLAKLQYLMNAQKEVKKISIELSHLKSEIKILKHMKDLSILKAPEDGIVMDMHIHSVGEVITPFKPILTIATKQFIAVEAYVFPNDIDKIHLNQITSILFPTYVAHSHVPIEGKITYISPDLVHKNGSKENYYKIVVTTTKNGMKTIKENNLQIFPGLQSATVYIGKDDYKKEF